MHLKLLADQGPVHLICLRNAFNAVKNFITEVMLSSTCVVELALV
jgi:hypothetical protein